MPYTFPPLGCDKPQSCVDALAALNKARFDAAAACISINELTLQISQTRFSIGSLQALISAQSALVGSLTNTAASLQRQFSALMAAGYFFAGLAVALAISCAASYGITCGYAVAAAGIAAALFNQARQVNSQLAQVNSQLSDAVNKLNDMFSQLNALNNQLQALQTQLQNAQAQLGAAQQAFQTQLMNVYSDCTSTCIANLGPTGMLQPPSCSITQLA